MKNKMMLVGLLYSLQICGSRSETMSLQIYGSKSAEFMTSIGDHLANYDKIKQKELAEKDKIITDLQRQVSPLTEENRRLTDLQRQVSPLTEENRRLKEEITGLKTQASTLEAEVDSLTTACTKLTKDNEFLTYSEYVTLHARHLWTAATAGSAAMCAGASFLLSRSDKASSTPLAVTACTTGLLTIGLGLKSVKSHSVYGKAFTDLCNRHKDGIKSPADQRLVIGKIRELNPQTSVASILYGLIKKESN